MKLKSFISNLAAFGLASAFVAGCGDNPIEIENERSTPFTGVADSLKRMEQGLDSLDYYTCLAKTGDVKKNEDRCKAAIELVASDTSIKNEPIQKVIERIVQVVHDTVHYDNSGAYIPPSSSSQVVTTSSSSEQIHYLEKSKQLNIKLTGYKQKVESLRANQATGKVFVRFEVSTFIEGDSTGYAPITGLYLDAYDQKTWTGKVDSGFNIPRGVDSVAVCPIVYDQVETADGYDNSYLMQNKCFGIGQIGLIKESSHSESSSNDKIELEWSWNLFETDK